MTEQKSGRLQYKCRRCGIVFEGDYVFPNLMDIIFGRTVNGKRIANIIKTHLCENEPGIGIADCIGGIYENE